MENLTQEEIEYRRYLRRRIRQRKRRRQVLIARCIVAAAIVLFFVLIFGILHAIAGRDSDNNKKVKPQVQTTVAATVEPTATAFSVKVPDGYEKIYNKLLLLMDEYPDVEEILMNLSQYPKDILKLAVNNQETLSFVKNYPKHQNDTEASGDINEEEVTSGIPLFQQWDERWGYVKYGGNIIAIDGCGPTCISMVYSGLTKDTSMSPAAVAAYCMDNDYYSSDTGTSWTLMTEGAQDFSLSVNKLIISEASLRTELDKGHPIICSMAPGDFTSMGHFIVLTGITSKGKILINDPNSIARSEKKWNVERVIKQIKAAWSYSVS